MDSIYLDHQATTPTTDSVYEAMKPYWVEKFGNPHSSEHIIGMVADREITRAKEKISSTLCCEPDEIFFTSGATESNNTAIYSLCALSRFHSAKQVIISAIEHKCVIEAAKHWTDVFRLNLEIVRVDKEGFIDQSQLTALLRTPTLFCSIIAVNNEIGTIQKLDEISKVVFEAGSIFHSDAAQALKTDLGYNICDHVDMASFSGHKIGGPQGIGCLYISAAYQEHFLPLIFGGGQQNGIRSGTLPLALCIGLSQAFEDLENLDFKKIREVRDAFFEELKQNVEDIQLNGPCLEKRHACNLNIYIPSIDNLELISRIQPHVAVSSGSACGAGNLEASHVLRALPTSMNVSNNSIRISFSEQTSCSESSKAVKIIAKTINTMRRT